MARTILSGIAHRLAPRMLAAILLAPAAAIAGDLTPPAPPGPTMLSLDEVEPRTPIGALTTPGDATATFVITAPGSYFLTGNMTGEAGKAGVRIDASGVSIDLRGFTMFGVPGSLDGITTDPDLAGDILISDGSLTGWGEHAVDIEFTQLAPIPNPRDARIERIRAVRNGSGIRALGTGTLFTDCLALENTQFGINGGGQAVFTRCQAIGNGGTGNAAGIRGNFSCVFIDCVSSYNDDRGFATGIDAVMERCSARGNGMEGVRAEARSRLRAVVASQNGTHGIVTEAFVDLRDCSATENNFDGFLLFNDVTMRDCSAWANERDGIGFFIDLAVRVSLTGFTATQNGRDGVVLGDSATLDGCVTVDNIGDGVVAGANAQLLNHRSTGNGGDGARIGAGGTVRDGMFNENANGVVMNDGCLVESTICRANTAYGVYAEDATANEDDGQSRIDGCVIDLNGVAGIFVEDQTLITNNKVSLNGAAGGVSNGGVVIGSRGSRLDTNDFTQNTGYAIRLLDSRNVVVRNSFFLNSSNVLNSFGMANVVGAIGSDPALLGPWDNIAH